MALNSNALITLDYAKIHLGIPLATLSYDARIEAIVNSASAMIARYCRRVLISESYTEYFDGRGQNRLLLHEWPASSVTAIYQDNDSVFPPSSAYDSGTYFLEKQMEIVFIDRTLPRGYRNIKVEYTAGYGTAGSMPSDIEWACAELVSWFYNSTTNHRIGVLTQAKQGETISYEQTLPDHIRLTLEPYVRLEFAQTTTPIRNN